ncbi:MAG: hypothetical protein KUG78_05150 [Kangiellaceae bacterium]|nr:hypothetical protein [Kangiellaceae bacterium]
MQRVDKQKGQSLILVTLFLGIISITVLVVFNAGILSKERVKLQNTADAAAYSAAVLVARDLNFQSYTNRAMVANQVAIGQYVGLSSWLEMLTNSADNLATITSWIPYVAAVTSAIDSVMDAVNSVAQPILEYATTLTDYVIQGISIGQKGFHVAMGLASYDTANKVIEANDPKINFGAASIATFTADNYQTWVKFPESIDTSSDNEFDKTRKKEFHSITNDSRDRFSKYRTHNWFTLNLLVFKIRVKKAGGSDLVDSGDNTETWTAMDTVAIWFGNYKCKPFSCRWKWNEAIPTGWASARSGENYNMYKKKSGIWGNTWDLNPITSNWAASNMNEVGSYSGLQDFYDIKDDGLIDNTPSVRVILGKSDSDLRTSANAKSEGIDGELAHWGEASLNIEEGSRLAGSDMSAISKADVYFKRPNDLASMRRLDGRYEFGNLYSPYWQPRLIDTNSTDRVLSMLIINAL